VDAAGAAAAAVSVGVRSLGGAAMGGKRGVEEEEVAAGAEVWACRGFGDKCAGCEP